MISGRAARGRREEASAGARCIPPASLQHRPCGGRLHGLDDAGETPEPEAGAAADDPPSPAVVVQSPQPWSPAAPYDYNDYLTDAFARHKKRPVVTR